MCGGLPVGVVGLPVGVVGLPVGVVGLPVGVAYLWVWPTCGCGLPVGVAGDLVAHHHTVHQPLGQQAGVVVSQLGRGQLPQVLTLDTQRGHVTRGRTPAFGESSSEPTIRRF